MSAGGGGSGQRSAVSGLQGSGPPPALVAPVLSPTRGGARPFAAPYNGGVWVGRPGSVLGGVPMSPRPPLALIASAGGVRPSPASSLVWGLGLRLRRVSPAVAPVGEGVAQSPGEPLVGIRMRDAEHRPPLQESRPRGLPVGPRRPNHRPEDPLVVLWGRPPPRGHLPVPPVPPQEHGIEGPVPHPPGGPRAGPAQPPVHFHHQGPGLGPRGVRDRAPVPVPGPGPLCPPRWLPLRPLCLRRRRCAPPPLRRGSGHPRRLRPWRGGGRLVLGSGGLGGDEVTGLGVDVVEVGVVVVVVVGVVRRHLLDAGGDAPHRLHVRLRGAPRSPSPSLRSVLPPWLPRAAPSVPVGPRRPCPCPWVPSRPLRPLSAPWVPPSVTCTLACTAGARTLPLPVSMPLAVPTLANRALFHSPWLLRGRPPWRPARARACPSQALVLSLLLARVVPSAARALPHSAAAGLGTVPAPSPSLLAVCALACPLRVSLGTPPAASCPPLRAPVAGTLPRLCAAPPLPDDAPGVLLPPQLRQRDARRRTLGRRGADVPRPPRGEAALRGERLGGAGLGVAGVGVGTVLRAESAALGR